MNSLPQTLTGSLRLRLGDLDLNEERLLLLETVDQTGSIGRAAKACGISYRTAWNWIDQINHAAGTPLFETRTGGAAGGGTTLSPRGRTILAHWREWRELHSFWLARLSQSVQDTLPIELGGMPGSPAESFSAGTEKEPLLAGF